LAEFTASAESAARRPGIRPLATRPVATALIAAVAPLTVAAPLVYLVGRHLPG
jgi:hypothetical protein